MSNTVINTNVPALNAARASRIVSADQMRSSARLSSGLKINTAADDAAGLAISEKMRAQIRGLDMASKNSQDAISFVQVAEGGISEINNMVQRMRELTVQAANDTNVSLDKNKIMLEVQQLVSEVDSMSNRVEFNKQKLISNNPKNDGTKTTVGSAYHMQVGANASQSLEIYVSAMGSDNLSLGSIASAVSVGGSTASAAITQMDDALNYVTNMRAQLGAYQNRLEYTIKSLEITSENTSAAESRIRDTDMAKEMMKLTRSNILQQAANSMLAQANQAPQQVLQLLR